MKKCIYIHTLLNTHTCTNACRYTCSQTYQKKAKNVSPEPSANQYNVFTHAHPKTHTHTHTHTHTFSLPLTHTPPSHTHSHTHTPQHFSEQPTDQAAKKKKLTRQKNSHKADLVFLIRLEENSWKSALYSFNKSKMRSKLTFEVLSFFPQKSH